MTDEENAREKCLREGMDPDFVGTKGYPNWKMFTREESERMQAFLAETAKITGVKP
jgi:putative sterol carrier protein